MRIVSCVGSHDISIYTGSTFDPTCRKYKGGTLLCTIPFSGTMLSAKVEQKPADPIVIDGVEIPTNTPQIFTSVDPLPVDDSDPEVFFVVSALYVSAVKSLGGDTSRLLTIGGTVVDDDGRTIGATGFNRN